MDKKHRETTPSRGKTGLKKAFDDRVIKAYTEMDIPVKRFVLTRIVPSFLGGLFLSIILLSIFPIIQLSHVARAAVDSIPALTTAIILLHPILKREKKKMQIDSYMNLFITRMGVLATANLPRKEMIRILSSVKEYGGLSEEMKKMYELMDVWNYGLPEAARYVARRTPSIILSDFLNRLAHSIEAGEPFNIFLKKEQTVVMTEYAVMYEGALRSVEAFKEIFISLITSAIFMILFVTLLPMIIDTDTTYLMVVIIALFIMIEVLMVAFIKTKLPDDNLWHSMEIRPKEEKRIKKAIKFFVISSVGIAGLLILLGVDAVTVIAISVTPLIIPGLMISRAESTIKRCDDNYDSFMRAVGSVVESSGGSIEGALKKLRKHDFGPLSGHIDVLYHRLLTRIDNLNAWIYFSAETGSNLISRFTEMYIKAMKMGGKPTEIGAIISDNFIKMVSLRKDRYQQGSNLTGVLYGLTIAMTMTLFLSISIMQMMNNAYENIQMPTDLNISIPIFVTHYNIPLMNAFMFVIVTVHAAASSYILRLANGSHNYIFFLHFTLMIWVAAVGAMLSRAIMPVLMGGA